MMECSCDNSSMQHGVQATVSDGSSKTIVIDVIAQGEKGEKGDSAELTEEQMQEIKDSMVKNASGISGDSYSEYMLVNGAMEKIGTTATNVDLSNYLTNDDVQGMTIQELGAMLD